MIDRVFDVMRLGNVVAIVSSEVQTKNSDDDDEMTIRMNTVMTATATATVVVSVAMLLTTIAKVLRLNL